ncbi:shikimate dehydrogenase [Halosquirtibacter xylanolyticus]|uniref:shikimate dehydrogenase family protein n=1 Tax=Halosquirtibacter xylanolyticus TaxID=3374599 RepID=UPI003749745D|nr:shikimate dehydrogenase [Prolixibacteraceae bacterium]
MKKYGLLGYPLSHSFSKGYFTAKFKEETIDAEYHNFELPKAFDIIERIKQDPSIAGLNITIPHKQSIIPLLNKISKEAKEIGAVNVVKVSFDEDGQYLLFGFNSDVYGFSESIRPLINAEHKKALVLGTGGASKAVYSGLKSLGIEPTYVSRKSSEGVLGYEALNQEVISEYTVIVNATPLGTYPNMDSCPNIPYKYLTKDHLLYDLVYNPAETLFMKKGKEHGAMVKNGLEMLHLQAEKAWEFWNK